MAAGDNKEIQLPVDSVTLNVYVVEKEQKGVDGIFQFITFVTCILIICFDDLL